MSVKVIGDKALERELEKRFGIKEMVKVQDKALIAGAKVIVEEVKKQLKPSKDTGALINEVSFSKPEWINENVQLLFIGEVLKTVIKSYI